jgi:ligand-binding sensor domain-containing protein
MTALLLSSGALALDPNLSIRQLHHTAWGPSLGAPLGGAEALAQTNDGYLWIAGPSGLFKFDGIVLERIELPYDPKLSSLNLYTAFAPRGGGLWVGFRFAGVARLKEGTGRCTASLMGYPQKPPSSSPRRRTTRYGSRPAGAEVSGLSCQAGVGAGASGIALQAQV